MCIYTNEPSIESLQLIFDTEEKRRERSKKLRARPYLLVRDPPPVHLLTHYIVTTLNQRKSDLERIRDPHYNDWARLQSFLTRMTYEKS